MDCLLPPVVKVPLVDGSFVCQGKRYYFTDGNYLVRWPTGFISVLTEEEFQEYFKEKA